VASLTLFYLYRLFNDTSSSAHFRALNAELQVHNELQGMWKDTIHMNWEEQQNTSVKTRSASTGTEKDTALRNC